MKSYTKESKPFVPECKDYFSTYCIEDCNWFGVCWDFQREVIDDNRIQEGNESNASHCTRS